MGLVPSLVLRASRLGGNSWERVGGEAAVLIEFRALGAFLSDLYRLAYGIVVREEESFQALSEDGVLRPGVCAIRRCM